MTIKEIESLSCMTRANIRFYESEGLLSPVRMENGYRDYSEKDLAVLKKSACFALWAYLWRKSKMCRAVKRPFQMYCGPDRQSLKRNRIDWKPVNVSAGRCRRTEYAMTP